MLCSKDLTNSLRDILYESSFNYNSYKFSDKFALLFSCNFRSSNQRGSVNTCVRDSFSINLGLRLSACNLITKQSLAQVISSEFGENSNSTFFAEHLRTVISPVKHCSYNLFRKNEKQVSNFQKVGSPVMKNFSFFLCSKPRSTSKVYRIQLRLSVFWCHSFMDTNSIPPTAYQNLFFGIFLKVAPDVYAPRILLIVIFIW